MDGGNFTDGGKGETYEPLYGSLDLAATLVEAERRVLHERQRFDPFMDAIERAAQKNGLILEAPNISVLLGGERPKLTLSDYQLQFLVAGDHEYAGKIAREIARQLYQIDVKNDIKMGSTILVEEMDDRYILSVELRQLVTLAAFPATKDMTLARIAQPVDYPTLFAKGSIKALPPLLLMVRVYRDLHTPAMADRWGELAPIAADFENKFPEIRKQLHDSIKGGGKQISSQERRRIVETLMEVPEFILVGRAALKSGVPSRLQVVLDVARSPTEVTAAQIESRIGQFVAERVDAIVPGTVQIWQRPRLPTDPRLARLTVYLQRPDGSRDPLMDVFNVLAFDLVAVERSGGFRIARGYVLCRLLLADIWTLLVVTKMKLLHTDMAQVRLDDHFELLELAFKAARKFNAVDADYVGTYEPDLLFRKRVIQSSKQRQYKPIFFPIRHVK